MAFSNLARSQIRQANRFVDTSRTAANIPIFGIIFRFLALPGSRFFEPQYHFDNEEFPRASEILATSKENVIANITSPHPNGAEARRVLGTALHTLQDYYAHSNWVELGNLSIDPRLGQEILYDPTTPLPLSPDQRTAHPDNRGQLFDFGLTHLTSGYFQLSDPCFGLNPIKVLHGLAFQCPGIGKDAPGPATYPTARALAVNASVDYIGQILSDERVVNNARALKVLLDVQINGTLAFVIDRSGSMLRPLVNQFGEPVSNVSRIDNYKSFVKNVVTSLRGTSSAPETYSIVAFGDQVVDDPFITPNPDEFLTALNNINPVASQNPCPEFYYTAISKAIRAIESGSRVYATTDASAQDANMRPSVAMTMKTRQIQLHEWCYLPCGCSRERTSSGEASTIGAAEKGANSQVVDPNVPAVQSRASIRANRDEDEDEDEDVLKPLEDSGGQMFHLSRESDIRAFFTLIQPSLTRDFASLFSTRGMLSGHGPDFDIPVDASVSHIVFSVSNDKLKHIYLRRPSGAVIVAGDPGVVIHKLTSGSIIAVDKPDPGTWRLHVMGKGAFSAQASGNTPLQFANFQFVTMTGTSRARGPRTHSRPASSRYQTNWAF